MIPINAVAVACVDRGWTLLLTFTATAILVGLTRKGCRRAFGAERALQLWLLPLLSVLATQLPHVSHSSAIYRQMFDPVARISTVFAAQPMHAATPGWRVGVVLIWLAGIVGAALMAVHAQLRYRSQLRGATQVHCANSRWPVVRAARADVGPAMVGAWRVCIVLPRDFNARYNAVERTLIIAHETTHARRRDGLWCLLAQCVASVLWFHPLAWWALGAMKHDQELACDAEVLRAHGPQRRCYASAMLKTQAVAQALPIGCFWFPRHPLTERIAMLRIQAPGRRRRLAGAATLTLAFTVFAGGAYAASQAGVSVQKSGDAKTMPVEYQLDIIAQKSAGDASAKPTPAVTIALCSAAGTAAGFAADGWALRTTVTSDVLGGLRIDLTVLGPNDVRIAQAQWRGTVGHALDVRLKSPDGGSAYAFVVTPQAGCPEIGRAHV